jgi:hypothetical protein
MAQNTKAKNVPADHERLITDAVRDWTIELNNVNLTKITACYADRYRVDVYTRTYVDGSTISRNKIEASYFVKVNDGVVTDLTPPPAVKKRGLFD